MGTGDPSRRAPSHRLDAGADEALGALLDRAVTGVGHCLHHRRHPRSRGVLDHVAVVPAGVVVVDARADRGPVEVRLVGTPRRHRALVVGDADRTHLLQRVDRHCAAVRDLLDDLGHGEVPVHGALCLLGVSWPGDRSVELGGYRVMGPAALAGALRRPGPVAEPARLAVALALAATLLDAAARPAPTADALVTASR